MPSHKIGSFMVTTTDTSYAEIIERDGFTVLADALDEALISELETTIGAVTSGDGVYDRGGVYAIRNLLKLAPDVKTPYAPPKCVTWWNPFSVETPCSYGASTSTNRLGRTGRFRGVRMPPSP